MRFSFGIEAVGEDSVINFTKIIYTKFQAAPGSVQLFLVKTFTLKSYLRIARALIKLFGWKKTLDPKDQTQNNNNNSNDT